MAAMQSSSGAAERLSTVDDAAPSTRHLAAAALQEDATVVASSEPVETTVTAPSRPDEDPAEKIPEKLTAFRRVDWKGDGRLQRAELIRRFRQDGELAQVLGLGPSPSTSITDAQPSSDLTWADIAFPTDRSGQLDTDANDVITEDEFAQFWIEQVLQKRAAAIRSKDPAAEEALDEPAVQESLIEGANASASRKLSVNATTTVVRPEGASKVHETVSKTPAAPQTWQNKLVVLCELARDMIALGQSEPATSIAFRILELDGLLPQYQYQHQEKHQKHALVLMAALAKEFAANALYEPAATLAQQVLKLDASNVDAGGIIRYVSMQAHAWSESSRSHLPGVFIGREHADRAAYAIQSPARAKHGPRPRQANAAALNPRPGVPQQRPRAGRTIYVLPPRLSPTSPTDSTASCTRTTSRSPALTAKPPPYSSARQKSRAGRPVLSNTQAGAITPEGLRSQQFARQYEMVPVSVLLRESSTPKHTTSWVAMDEAAVPMGAENAEVLLRQAYEIREQAKRLGERLRDENEKLKSEVDASKRKIEILEAGAGQNEEKTSHKLGASAVGLAVLFDKMNTQAAKSREAAQDDTETRVLELPKERNVMLQQLCEEQAAPSADVVQRAQAFRCVFKALDLSGVGKIVKKDLQRLLMKEATIARMLRLPGSVAGQESEGSGFAQYLEQMEVGEDEEIEEEEFVAMSTVGLFKKRVVPLNSRLHVLNIMKQNLSEAERIAEKELNEADEADRVAAKEKEEARQAQLLAEKESMEAILAEKTAQKEQGEAEAAAANATREAEEAEKAEQVAEKEALEAQQAKEAATKEQEEARIAKEKADMEKADVIRAEKAREAARAALHEAQQSNDASAIATAQAALHDAEKVLSNEKSEYDAAMKVAEREAAEAFEAAAAAEKEMREAEEAREKAEVERLEAEQAARIAAKEAEEAEAARETADRERAEAVLAKQRADKETEEARVAVENAKRERLEAEKARQDLERVRAENAMLQQAVDELGRMDTALKETAAKQAEDLRVVREENARMKSQIASGDAMSTDEDVDNGLPQGIPFAPAAGTRLAVTIQSCQNLLAADSNGLSDPFCTLAVGQASTLAALAMPKQQHRDDNFPQNGQWLRTSTVHKTLNPVFDETFSVPLLPNLNVAEAEPLLLKIVVLDWDRIGTDDFLGEIEIKLASVLRCEPGFERTLTKSLQDPQARIGQKDLKKRIDADVKQCLEARLSQDAGRNESRSQAQHNFATGRFSIRHLYGKITFKLQCISA